MDTRFDFDSAFGPGASARSVYVRPVAVADLPAPLRAQAAGLATVYAVHRADGERLALVRERSLAFALARQNNLTPVNVH